MFWNKNPKCPIKIEDKIWVEDNLNWLNKNVVNLISQQTILPTKKYFDWEFKGIEKDAEFVLKKIGEYCGVDTKKIELDFYSEEAIKLDSGTVTQKEEGTGTAGLYIQKENSFSILVEVQQLKRPNSLIATLAHELSHFVLIGQKEVHLDGDENEWLTDLLSIAFGFGVFIGNTKFEFKQWQTGDGWGGWQTSTQGYLPQQITAYAMAKIEIKRTKEMPNWINLLKKDFQRDFKKSMKYLSFNK